MSFFYFHYFNLLTPRVEKNWSYIYLLAFLKFQCNRQKKSYAWIFFVFNFYVDEQMNILALPAPTFMP
jgi:hypothetical protein